MFQLHAMTSARLCRPFSYRLLHKTTMLAISAALMLMAQAIFAQRAGAEQASRPNVVLIMTDDQGYGDVAAHGNTKIRTPNIDKLYAQSLRLTNYHVDPTCSETRSALMTGRYSSRTGVWHTIMGRSILHRDERTMANVFAAAGYRCGMTGKWHLGDAWPYRPLDRGFHEAMRHGGGGIGQTPDFWDNDYFDDTYWHNGKPEPQKGYCTDVFFDWAMQFIERNKQGPFFCYIATNVPHGPYNVAEKYSRPYAEEGVPGSMANFYGMIENFDENLGRLVAKLEELKLADNTILVYTTDNGTAAGVARGGRGNGWQGFNAGMRGQKGSEYDGGHRVPCYIRWPGHIESGKDIARLAAHIDMLPTLADLCGVPVPAELDLDGKSLVPLMSGKDWPERTLVVHSQRMEHPQKWHKCSVMTDRWRLVDGKQLFDMEADPGQATDVAAANAAVVEKLRASYEAWWDHVDDRYDDYVRIPLGDEHANPTNFTCHDWHAGSVSQVPWNHGHIRAMVKANGFWAVDVAAAGRYEVTLRLRPAGVEFPLQKGIAEVQVGDVKASAPIAAGASETTVSLDLPAGPARLLTTLNEEGRGARGAYFVSVRKVD
ncbi:MAG: arylsulfatase [Planctomycetales bacterium]|nr:arylsulfatase [Planctomycetales bacterium]